jgi:flavodoxin
MNKKKSLVAYFSRAGNNYVGGSIVDLPMGNTEVAAKMIQKLTAGDMFKIDTVKAYPADYTETTEVAKKELKENARPELKGRLDNMEDYSVVYLAATPTGGGRCPWWC